MKDIKDLVYTSRDCGRAIKSSKHEYIWEFTVDGQRVMIQYLSYVSLKRKILYNKKIVSREYCSNNYYAHEFDIDGHNYKVSETFNFSDLLIDGVSFDHLYTLQKNANEFSKEQKPTTYYIKTENYHIGGDKGRIQRSNEINLKKKEQKDEKILNFSFKANNMRNNNNNNLRKFKFNNKENHLNIETNNNKTFVIPSKNNYNNFNTVQNNKINLIDFDDDSFENNNNKQDNKKDFNCQKDDFTQNNNLDGNVNDYNNQIFDIRNKSNLNNNNTDNYTNNNKNNQNSFNNNIKSENNNNINLLDLNIFNNNNNSMMNNNMNFNNNKNNYITNNTNMNFNNNNNIYNKISNNNNNISNNNSNNINELVDYFN